MKKNKLKQVLSLTVTALMFSQLAAFAPVSAAEDTSGSSAGLFTKSAETSVQAPYRDNEKVRIIIELDDKPLISDAGTGRNNVSLDKYISTKKGQQKEASLDSSRKRAVRRIRSKDVKVDVEAEYSAVMNGLAVTAKYGDLDDIKKTSGVKNAFVAQEHRLVEPVYEPKLSDSVPGIGGDIVKETGYTGKGTAVAILDTGLDTDHEAFKGSVNSPRYSENDISRILNNNQMTMGQLSASVLYKSSKIPFAYDYAGNDTNVSGGASHGTHVAGIVGANAGEVRGVAPDAQLMIMKIFDDAGTGAYDDKILSALDDSVKLGADAINMSLGSDAGFSEDSSTVMRDVYTRVQDAGIDLLCAAGNAYSSAYNGAAGNNLLSVNNPDNSIVSSPSTYSAALSVASSNNANATLPYFAVGDHKIRYDDSADGNEKKITELQGTFDYVPCGYGTSSDFESKNVQGKIALIERGGTENGEPVTFSQKEQNARSAGAVAAVVYNNVDGELVPMATSHAIPCISISRDDGDIMLSAADKKMTIDSSFTAKFSDSTSSRMSDFSSWGPAPDLTFKPEITAPGGNIYSTLPGNKYGNMSGTSMATPHMTGAAAIMYQYINSQLNGSSMSSGDKTELANDLMMSTAVPVRESNGNLYSPRKQGAGLVRLDKATATKAYLTSENGGRPEVSLKDNEGGNFSFSYQVKNLSEQSLKYNVSVNVQTESVTDLKGKKCIAEKARTLDDSMVKVTTGNKVTVSPSGTTKPSVRIELTDKGRKELKEQFPNGIYIEGFVTLIPEDSNGVELSIPYMGFYGSWGDVPIFDASVYDTDKTPDVTGMSLIAQSGNSSYGEYISGYTLGRVQYGDGSKYNGKAIAVKGGDKSIRVTAACALLRNVDRLEYSVTDSSGQEIYKSEDYRHSKSTYSQEGYYMPTDSTGWGPVTSDEWGDSKDLPDGNYTYTVTGISNGKSQSVSFPIAIDSQMPEIVSSEISGSKWIVKVKDNQYVQAVAATTGGTPLTGWVNPDQSEPGQTVTVEFDLSDESFKGLDQARIAIADFADNQYVSDWYSLTSQEKVDVTSVTLNKSSLVMTEGDTADLTASVTPDNASDKSITWNSSNTSVASVNGSGKVTALKEGTATVTATSANGKSASCAVTVKAKEKPEDPSEQNVLASISAPSAAKTGSDIPFLLQLENLNDKKAATVSFEFNKDDDVDLKSSEGLNGFTQLGEIKWDAGGKHGVIMLSYLQGGAGASYSGSGSLTDIARLVGSVQKESASAGIRLTDVKVSGYDDSGHAVWIDSSIKNASAKVKITDGNYNIYDVNRDGKVDQLDITTCQKYYQAATGDDDWTEASICDVNNDNKVDIEDITTILNNFAE